MPWLWAQHVGTSTHSDAAHKVREYWEQKRLTQIPEKLIVNAQLPPVSSVQPGSGAPVLRTLRNMLPCQSPKGAKSVKGCTAHGRQVCRLVNGF